MNAIKIDLKDIKAELLAEELRAALGARSPGASWDDTHMTVHIHDALTPDLVMLVETVVNAHDPARLSESERRQQAIDQARHDFAGPLEPETITLRDLACRVAWLESELRDLRALHLTPEGTHSREGESHV